MKGYASSMYLSPFLPQGMHVTQGKAESEKGFFPAGTRTTYLSNSEALPLKDFNVTAGGTYSEHSYLKG
jgi:hypothetical protein